MRYRCGFIVHGGYGDMANHDHIHASFYPRLEGQEFAGAQLFQALVHNSRALVRIRRGVAMAREMLHAADDARLREPAHRRGDELRRLAEFVRIGPVPYHCIRRVRPHVGHRGKISVEQAAYHVRADGQGVLVRRVLAHVLVAVHGVDEGRAQLVHEPAHVAPLLVRADDEGYLGIRLRVLYHLPRLLLRDEVVHAVDEPADGVLLQSEARRLPRCGDGALPCQDLGTDYHELTELLTQAHAREQLLRARQHRVGRRRRLRGRGRCGCSYAFGVRAGQRGLLGRRAAGRERQQKA